MHYGLGPEVDATYRRQTLRAARPPAMDYFETTAAVEDSQLEHGRLLEWIGHLLIDAGERLGGKQHPQQSPS